MKQMVTVEVVVDREGRREGGTVWTRRKKKLEQRWTPSWFRLQLALCCTVYKLAQNIRFKHRNATVIN